MRRQDFISSPNETLESINESFVFKAGQVFKMGPWRQNRYFAITDMLDDISTNIKGYEVHGKTIGICKCSKNGGLYNNPDSRAVVSKSQIYTQSKFTGIVVTHDLTPPKINT